MTERHHLSRDDPKSVAIGDVDEPIELPRSVLNELTGRELRSQPGDIRLESVVAFLHLGDRAEATRKGADRA
jgi:hypothetical protein